MTEIPAIEPCRDPDRRDLLQGLGVGALAALAASPALAASDPATDASGLHDFDFLIGRWRVAHRRLKERLSDDTDWESFGGTCNMRPILSGRGNIDDNVIGLPSGAYEGVGLRLFDAKAETWSIWWIDGRNPSLDDPPVTGRFRAGVGEFLGDDVLRGMPIRVRYRWSAVTARSCHWEQAFSPDAGKSWETNWVMQLTREA